MFTIQVEPRDLDDAKSEQKIGYIVESDFLSATWSSLDDAQSLSNLPRGGCAGFQWMDRQSCMQL